MTKRHRFLLVTLGTLFVLLSAAVSIPDENLRRILFATVIVAAIALLVAYSFLVTAEQAWQEEMINVHAALLADSRTEIADLRAKFYVHVAACATQQLGRGMDIEQGLNILLAQSKPKEG